MRGVTFIGNRQLEIQEFKDPEPGPGQVVVDVKSSGICGSDLHFYRPADSPPYIAGHEPAGIVTKLGEGVRSIQVGDRVSIYHWVTCGQCSHCKSGFLQQCEERRGFNWHTHGSHADQLLSDERYCLKLPVELDFMDGSIIACGGGTAFSVVKKLDLSGNSRFVLFGAGPLGLASMLLAKAYGTKVIMVDISDERLEFAEKAGADIVINSSKQNVVEAVKDVTRGRGADKLLDTSAFARNDAIACADTNARIGLVGMRHNDYLIDFDPFIRKQLSFVGSYVFPITMYPEIVDFMVDHRVHFSDLVTRTFKLEEAEEAYRLFDTGQTQGKFMFVW
jgi:propanol-preferring alcohol dehydrogenase